MNMYLEQEEETHGPPESFDKNVDRNFNLKINLTYCGYLSIRQIYYNVANPRKINLAPFDCESCRVNKVEEEKVKSFHTYLEKPKANLDRNI